VDRLFIDANVLYSAAYREDAGVARLWQLEGTALITSEYAIEEARRNLDLPEQRARLERLLRSMERTSAGSLDPSMRQDIELREKDWPILGAAVVSGATHLVTGDVRDFGAFFGTTVLGVHIVPPAVYLRTRS
jgi:predicted nucleic acid-binding protein